MDPLSIAASIAALVQTAGFVLKCAKGIKNASREQDLFRIELKHFIQLLKTLKSRVEGSQPDDPWFGEIRSLCVPDGLLDSMQRILRSLEIKTRQHNTFRLRFKAKVLWQFEKDEVQSAFSAIKRLASIISIALEDDHFNLDLAIKADTSRSVQILTEMQAADQRQTYQNALQWLKPPDVSQSYHFALQKCQPESGQWLLTHPTFLSWTASPSCFWLYGKPGCGKTVLSSVIVRKLLSGHEDSTCPDIAHFFVESSDNTKRSVGDLLRSMLVQFGSQRKQQWEIIHALYRKHSAQLSQPTNEELCSALHELILTKAKAYIIIDGLEESSDLKSMLKVIRELSHNHRDNLHLLVTSRLDKLIKDDFDTQFLMKLEVTPDLVRSDIQQYVSHTLENEKPFLKWDSGIRTEILHALTLKSDGMFQWVYCQLEELESCVTEKSLRTALATLPATLSDTYENLLLRIEQNGYRADAIRILQWLCHARRPMPRRALVDCLAVELEGGPTFSERRRIPDPNDILKLCASLITITERPTKHTPDQSDNQGESGGSSDLEDPEIRLSHFSVREHLVSTRSRFQTLLLKEPASAVITQSCLTYLLHLCELEVMTDDIISQYPLATYAAQFWFEHLNSLNWMKPREEILDDAVRLVKVHPKGLDTWRRIVDIDRQYDTQLQFAICMLLMTSIILENPVVSGITASDIMGPRTPGSPLYYACLTGNIALVKKLLDTDVDLNAPQGGWLSYPLAAALSTGHQQLKNFLLTNGAKEGAVPLKYRSLALVRYLNQLLHAPTPDTASATISTMLQNFLTLLGAGK